MGVVEGGGSRCSVVQSLLSSSPDLPFRLQWNLLQDGAPPALPRSAGAPAAAKEKTKVIMELEPTTRGSIKEDSVGYRKQVLTSSPALIRQQEDTISPLFKLVPRSFLVTRTTSPPCSRVTRGKSDSLRFLRSCHIKQDIDCKGNLNIVILHKTTMSFFYTLKIFCVF